jgi:hypothetical protein
MRARPILIAAGLGLTALGGYWLASTAQPPARKKSAESARPLSAFRAALNDPPLARRIRERTQSFRSDDEALAAGALPGQRALIFTDRAALERFLARAGDRIRVLDRLDALNALRIGFLDYADLADLLDGSEEASMIYPAYLPDPNTGTVQAGAQPIGNRLLEWLGITGDNSQWGAGIRIAVLDTGVTAHSAFSSDIWAINLVDLPMNLQDWNGHGTAVASLIIGNDSLTPGVVPGADLISVRIADDSGRSDSFLIAQGIMAAVDSGAQIINISLGSAGDSALVRNAIAYANSNGAVIVASAGNDGVNRVSYPAANVGVIAVGAVDASGTHLQFSNSGDVAAAAPGYEVNAAWPGEQAIRFTGTSGSSPIFAAAVAAVMSQTGLNAEQASLRLLSTLNDGGAPGYDEYLGGGTLDVGRAIAADTRGVYDVALASHWVIPPTETNPYPQLQIVVQNRGTETVNNSTVSVNFGAGDRFYQINSLTPNAIQTVTVPLPAGSYTSGQSLRFDSTVRLNGQYPDIKTSNNQRLDTYVPPQPVE